MTTKYNCKVARLDGFVSALASIDGAIRDYSAYAYLLENIFHEKDAISSLQAKFSPYASLIIDSIVELRRGSREFEPLLQANIFRENSLLMTGDGGHQELVGWKKYLSFRIMDMIDDIIGGKQEIRAYKINAAYNTSRSLSEFLCMKYGNRMLVLQFNDDRAQKGAKPMESDAIGPVSSDNIEERENES